MKIIAGLGNPGNQYNETRHNIGFYIVSKLMDYYQMIPQFNKKFNSMIAMGEVHRTKLVFLMPHSYMNLSGESISMYLRYYKMPKKDLIVVYDDIAISFGGVKFKRDGRDAGHNGVKSIIQALGTDEFDRLKIGIGPDPGGALRSSFVLSKFTPVERDNLDIISKNAVKAVETYLFDGMDKAMNSYNKINFLSDKDIS